MHNKNINICNKIMIIKHYIQNTKQKDRNYRNNYLQQQIKIHNHIQQVQRCNYHFG